MRNSNPDLDTRSDRHIYIHSDPNGDGQSNSDGDAMNRDNLIIMAGFILAIATCIGIMWAVGHFTVN